ncbi:MAG: hypothetical protein WBG37_10980 [Desulfobacterales bacterium]
MPLTRDIRPLKRLVHGDVAGLNFIRVNPKIRFRKHYREGLRSQIIEVLYQEDLDRETRGVVEDGIRRYPRARPRKMLRLFRAPFETPGDAFREALEFDLLKTYLGREHLAQSSEFIVTYRWDRGEMIMLCGLQQYVEGCMVNPWSLCQGDYREMLYQAMPWPAHYRRERPAKDQFVEKVGQSARRLITKVRRMITETGSIPDLAGVGNLIVTPRAHLKLVDINNVSPLEISARIYLDGRGYPVSDKSVEVLALLEEKLVGRPVDRQDPLYVHFLDARRMAAVRIEEKRFRQTG